jgi:hypothetical protein
MAAVNKPGEEEPQQSSGLWQYLLIVAWILLGGVVIHGVYLTYRLMRAPVPAAARQSASSPASAAGLREEKKVPVPVQPEPAVSPQEATAETGTVDFTLAPQELADHLWSQREILHEEARGREGDANGLTPPPEAVEKITTEGRVIY